MTARERMLRLAWWLTAGGALVTIAGLLMVLAYSASEVLGHPNLSLEDGYWIGRLPWTPIGVGLVVAGATVALVAGTLTALLAGGILRRVAVVLSLGVGTFWWFAVTVPMIGMGGAWCSQPTCRQPQTDPITMAYSSPELTAIWLLLPALAASIAALTSRSGRGTRNV